MNSSAIPLIPPSGSPFVFEGRRLLKRGAHLSLYADRVRPEGKDPFDYEIAVRENEPRIITALPVTKNGEALLIWQYRIPMRRYVLENVAGLVDSGMAPKETVVKEIREETGYSVRVADILDLKIMTPASSGATTEKIECFAAFGAEPSGVQELESAESIQVVRLPLETAFETALATAASGELVDAKVFALLALVREKFFRTIAAG